MKKKLIIVLFIILILITGLTISIVYLKKNETTNVGQELVEQEEDVDEGTEEYQISDMFYKMTELVDSSEFFEIQSKIDDYYKMIEGKQSNELLEVLDTQYINDKKITNNNVLDLLKHENSFNKYSANQIYVLDNELGDDAKITYYIYGRIWSEKYTKKTDTFIVLTKLFKDDSYKIIPQDNIDLKEKKFEDIIKDKTNELRKNWEEFEKKYREEIYSNLDADEENSENEEDNGENESAQPEPKYSLKYKDISEEDLATNYMNDFRLKALYDTKKSYEIISNKEEKYKTYEDYDKFIKENRNTIMKMEVKTINVLSDSKSDDESIYEFIDQNNNKYTINVKSIMNYTVSIN